MKFHHDVGEFHGINGDAPRLTSSLRTAAADLGLERIAVLYPGDRRYPLSETVEAVPIASLATPGGLFGTAG